MVLAIVIVVADVNYYGCCVCFFLDSFGLWLVWWFLAWWCGCFWISVLFFSFFSYGQSLEVEGEREEKEERERERNSKKRIKKNI